MAQSKNFQLKGGAAPKRGSCEGENGPENGPESKTTDERQIQFYQLHRSLREPPFRSFESARRTIRGIETLNMIRKGQVRWLPKDDILGHALFIAALFGVSMAA
jgi:hypothetical protein